MNKHEKKKSTLGAAIQIFKNKVQNTNDLCEISQVMWRLY